MAKQVSKWECEICYKKYNTKDEANECESNHYVPRQVTNYKFNLQDNKSEYPESVNIELWNNRGKDKIITYYRKG